MALQAVRVAAGGGDVGNYAAEDGLAPLFDYLETGLSFLENLALKVVCRRFLAEPLAKLLFDFRLADDPRRFQSLNLDQTAQKILALVDHAIDHRFRQMNPDNLAGGPDMIRCRCNRECSECIQTDGQQNGQQSRKNADEKESDFCVEVHGAVFHKGKIG